MAANALTTMKTIPLTRGKVALVDDEDFEWLLQWKWCVHKSVSPQYTTWYAVSDCGGHYSRMHRLIAKRMGLDLSRHIDHKDNDGLNNQRTNLRPASNGENLSNARKKKGSTSIYKGVTRSVGNSRFRAQIKMNGHCFHLGYFDTQELAGLAYNEAAARLFGEYAHLNTVSTTECGAGKG